MKQVFPFFKAEDATNSSVAYESGNGAHGGFIDRAQDENMGENALVNAGKAGRDRIHLSAMPNDRFLRYQIYTEMADDSSIAATLELHIAYALSVNNKTQQAITLKPKNEKDTAYVAALNREVMLKINDQIENWCYPMVIYGVNYVRPYVEQGRGIVAWENNYHTLANQVREYERSGQLAGFTLEKLKSKPSGEQVRLAEPWALIALKIPSYRPDMNIEPVNYSGEEYSLYSDIYHRLPIETQNYGSSMLHTAYESWTLLRQSIASMQASRNNASLIDRMISVSTDNLDAARAAEYVNMVAGQFQQGRESIAKQSTKTGFVPTVLNTIIPVMTGGAKGGVNIDTFTTDPNISHIEDILFNLKRMCGTLGMEPSMIGFSDMMSTGLGDGGYLRNALQSTIRANQIRKAAATFVKRAIDIHTAFKDGKVWPEGEEPFEICFNSLSTAVEAEEAAAAEGRANYATIVLTMLDMLEQSSVNKSPTLKNHFYTNVLELEPEMVKTTLAELAKKTAEDSQMMESLGMGKMSKSEAEKHIRSVVFDVISEFEQ